MSAVGRNDPCSCGSGRKAKHCCLGTKGAATKTAPGIVLPAIEGLQPRQVPFAEAVSIAQNRQQHGDMAGAEKIYNLILAVDPDHGDAMFFLGVLNQQMGRTKLALNLMNLAAQKHPNVFKYHFNLGLVCEEGLAYKEAIASYRRALAIDPKPYVWNNLGEMLMQVGELEEATKCFRQAIKLQPNSQNAAAYNNLGNILQLQGNLEEAVENYAASMSIAPDEAPTRSNYLCTLNFVADTDLRKIFEAHKKFGERFDRPMAPRIETADPADRSDRRLRVGYVSPDFRQHAVSSLIEPTLAAHDKSKFEVFCYSNCAASDEVTKRIQKLATHWRPIANRPDEEVAGLVRQDRIDILVDLAGHTANNSLPMFGRKPAPVQVTWLGYSNTTGLSTMDYRITDAIRDPVGSTDAFHTEKLVRLPDTISCYQPPANSPDIGPLPASSAGAVMFGSFNKSTKMNPEVIETWADILRRVANSRLTLKYGGFQSASIQSLFAAAFARHGVEPDRLVFLGSDDYISHLQRCNSIDIALDPFPYNGDLTTCDSLWMGVPVIALAGVAYAGRMSASRLANAGLAELTASSRKGYADVAVALARDLKRLAALRSGLRARLVASPLMDATGFTRNLEQAYQNMWESHLSQKR